MRRALKVSKKFNYSLRLLTKSIPLISIFMDLAFCSLLPASLPAIKKSVFFDIEESTLPPKDLNLISISLLVKYSKRPSYYNFFIFINSLRQIISIFYI